MHPSRGRHRWLAQQCESQANRSTRAFGFYPPPLTLLDKPVVAPGGPYFAKGELQ
jgi:hypothetical protein